MKRPLIRIPVIAAASMLAMPFVQAHAGTDAARSIPAGPYHRAGTERFIVTYRQDSIEARDRDAVLRSVNFAVARAGLDKPARGAKKTPGEQLSAGYVRKLALGGDLIRLSRPLDEPQARGLMRAIAADPAVLHVERDARLQALSDSVAATAISPRTISSGDHPFPAVRWNYDDPRGGANVSKAWALADGSDVVVAVLDTGITWHPDLDLSLADAGYDFIRDAFTSGRAVNGRMPGGWDTGDWTDTPDYEECFDEPAGQPSSWHGTRIAGIVAGLAGGPLQGMGIARRAKVLPVRVLGHCGGNLADLADAIVWAAGGHVRGVPDNKHPAQVITLGLSAPSEDGCDEAMSLQAAVEEAHRRGAVVVAAAGNTEGDAILTMPAGCPGVIAVAANGVTGQRAPDSNFGSGIALAAPGGGGWKDGVPNGFLWSTSNQGTTVPAEPGYVASTGTGLAAAHVAGVAALMIGAVKQAYLPALTPEQIRGLLVGTARHFPVAPDRPIGAGILDAHAAVVKAVMGKENPEPVIRLERGVLQPGQGIAEGDSVLYAIEVPPTARYLHLRASGGTGDVTLHAKAGQPPVADGTDADAVSDKPGNNEAIIEPRPQPGTWYLRVHARQAVDKLSVLGNYAL